MGVDLRSGWHGAFMALAAIWGASFMLIKIGLETLSPLQVSLGRLACGVAVLAAVLRTSGHRLPRGSRLWGHLAVMALLLNAAPFSLLAIGETRVSSIVAGIWNATTPLLVLPVAFAMLPHERPTPRRVIGLGVGFLGVLVLLGPWRGLGGSALVGNAACLAAAACYGVGFPYARRFLAGRSELTIALATAQLLCGTIGLALVAPWTGGAPEVPPARVIASVVALGALGTGVAYLLNYRIIRLAGATVASSVTYVMPLFSTALGVLALGEELDWNQPAGAIGIAAGVAFSQGTLTRA